MQNFGFQEPCCIENTLPRLLRKYGLVTWQSNGDVTFEKMMKATAHMAGNSVKIILVVPEVDVLMLRYLRWYQQRGWLTELTILTQKPQQDLVRNEMPADMPLAVYAHKSVNEGMVIIYGEENTVVNQGSLHSTVTPALENYTSYCGNDGERISMLTNAITSRLRLLAKKASSSAPAGSASGVSSVAGVDSTEETPVPAASPAGDE